MMSSGFVVVVVVVVLFFVVFFFCFVFCFFVFLFVFVFFRSHPCSNKQAPMPTMRTLLDKCT